MWIIFPWYIKYFFRHLLNSKRIWVKICIKPFWKTSKSNEHTGHLPYMKVNCHYILWTWSMTELQKYFLLSQCQLLVGWKNARFTLKLWWIKQIMRLEAWKSRALGHTELSRAISLEDDLEEDEKLKLTLRRESSTSLEFTTTSRKPS